MMINAILARPIAYWFPPLERLLRTSMEAADAARKGAMKAAAFDDETGELVATGPDVFEIIWPSLVALRRELRAWAEPHLAATAAWAIAQASEGVLTIGPTAIVDRIGEIQAAAANLHSLFKTHEEILAPMRTLGDEDWEAPILSPAQSNALKNVLDEFAEAIGS